MKKSNLRPGVFLLLIVALTALRPGDGSWVSDEPIMMEMAIRYNRTASDLYGVSLPFTPCPYGLQGTRGAAYGPLPVWIDQVFLALTHNVVHILDCRAVLFTSITVLALYWLTRTLGLSAWFAVITLFSPWLWMLSRSLWDSSWCVPISAVLVAAYAAFLNKPAATSLCLTVLCCILLPMVHLTAVAMVLPIGLHLLVFHRRQLWRWKWSVGAIALLCLYIFWPYLVFFFTHTRAHFPPDRSLLLGWLFPLLGGHYLTLGVAGTMPGDGWQDHAPKILRSLVAGAQWFARIALAAVWLGMILAIPQAWRAVRRPENAVPTQHLCLVALAIWICQTFLDGIERLYFSPQYYAATWIVYAFFAWIAVDWLMRRSAQFNFTMRGLLGIYSASLLMGILIIAATIARNAGVAGGYYGTSLANQIEAVKQIRQFSNRSKLDIQFTPWELHPLAYQVLMELNPAGTMPLPARHLIVKYRNAYPGDARIEVQALPAE